MTSGVDTKLHPFSRPETSAEQMIRLDLGAGSVSLPGFTPLGNAHGRAIYPLPYADNSVGEIYASHVLEHFPRGRVPIVLRDWVRVLKPGGVIKIAVPDFNKIAESYIAGDQQITEGYVMGGQVDEADYHKALFDSDKLRKLLASCGLMLIRQWKSDLPDCAALPISLNLEGTKPHLSEISVCAVMSVPRLGFMDNFFCSFQALPQLRIKISRYTGAFWEQCIERTIDGVLSDEKPDAILALDYDTVFTRNDVSMLMQLMCCHPEVDAIAPVQSGRGGEKPLFTVSAEEGQNLEASCSERFAPDLSRASTAHFGLTLLRASKLRALPKPWFWSQPALDGTWGPGKVDADIYFWRKWEAARNSLHIANRVAVGHLDLTVDWPGDDLLTIRQPIHEWRANGRPKDTWQ